LTNSLKFIKMNLDSCKRCRKKGGESWV